MHNGVFHDTEDLEITYGDVTKGGLEVRSEGKLDRIKLQTFFSNINSLRSVYE